MYLELNRNESRIMVERLRALLTFHGLLLAAVGVSSGQRLFLLAFLLACVGLLLCVPWIGSVRLSYRGCENIGHTYDNLKPADAPGLDACRISKWWEFSSLPEVLLPWVVLVTWALVLLVIVYYWRHPPLALSAKP